MNRNNRNNNRGLTLKDNVRLSLPTIGILIIGCIFIAPLLFMVFGSLKTPGELASPEFTLFPKNWKVENYQEVFTRGTWMRWIINTAWVTILATGGSLLLNLSAGYALARLEFPGKRLFFFIVLVGLFLPPQVTLAPTYILMARFPLIGGNSFAGQGGTGFIDTYAGLVIPFIAGSFGVFMARQFYLGFPKSLEESAELDGCGHIEIFQKIYLPLSGPLLASLGILKATATWNQYDWPLVITNSRTMRTVQIALDIFKGETSVEWHLLLAATTMVAFPLLIAFMIWQKAFLAVNASEGIKG